MRTSSISKLMKSNGQPKMGIHIVFRKYMYFRQTDLRMKTSQCEIFFSWAKTRNAFYSNCRTFAHPSSDLGVASWIQIERTTQPTKQQKSQELKQNLLSSPSTWKLDSTYPLTKRILHFVGKTVKKLLIWPQIWSVSWEELFFCLKRTGLTVCNAFIIDIKWAYNMSAERCL